MRSTQRRALSRAKPLVRAASSPQVCITGATHRAVAAQATWPPHQPNLPPSRARLCTGCVSFMPSQATPLGCNLVMRSIVIHSMSRPVCGVAEPNVPTWQVSSQPTQAHQAHMNIHCGDPAPFRPQPNPFDVHVNPCTNASISQFPIRTAKRLCGPSTKHRGKQHWPQYPRPEP